MTAPTPQRGEIERDTLIRWLNNYLNLSTYAATDLSLNGLQIEGTSVIRRVAASVDSSLKTLQHAADAGADLLITHHGLFWGQPLPLTGPHRERVRTALMADLNLYAAHLPLDAHPEVGNSAMIARALSLQNPQPFAAWGPHPTGLYGDLPFEQTLQDFADRVQKLTGEICLVHGGGVPTVRRLGVTTGSGAEFIAQAAQLGLDTLLTGEPEHKHFHDAFEYGVNVVYAGHYETEVFGVRALAARLEEEFGLPWQFLHHPTGL